MTPEFKLECQKIIDKEIWPFFERAFRSHNKSVAYRIFARKGRITGFKEEIDKPNEHGG